MPWAFLVLEGMRSAGKRRRKKAPGTNCGRFVWMEQGAFTIVAPETHVIVTVIAPLLHRRPGGSVALLGEETDDLVAFVRLLMAGVGVTPWPSEMRSPSVDVFELQRRQPPPCEYQPPRGPRSQRWGCQ